VTTTAISFFVFGALGTVFGPPESDRGNKGILACTGSRLRKAHPEDLELLEAGWLVAAQPGVLKCWDRLTVCLPRTGRCLPATVADFLPPKFWRSSRDLDLWHEFARDLGHNGFERVLWKKHTKPRTNKKEDGRVQDLPPRTSRRERDQAGRELLALHVSGASVEDKKTGGGDRPRTEGPSSAALAAYRTADGRPRSRRNRSDTG